MREEYPQLFQILRKYEYTFVHKCTKTPFWCSWSSRATTLRLPIQHGCGNGRKWDNLRDCNVEKGVHFLGLCTLRGTRDCWLELLQKSLNHEVIEYCDVILCICIHVHLW
jgi:hypothetical protein